jgi:uncharacterized iron-regulated protein
LGLILRFSLLLTVLLAGCAGRVPKTPTALTAPPGSFLSAQGEILPDAEVVCLAQTQDFILMGESHTNPCDHAVQARLMEALARSGTRFVLGLEMLPVTVQPALDAFHTGQINAAELEHQAQWEKYWGYPYNIYRPVLDTAAHFHLPVAALNIPRETLLRFRDQKPLSAEEQALLPRQIIPPCPAQEKTLLEQVKMHQDMRNMIRTKGDDTNRRAQDFFLVQSLWDSMMAEQALKWRNKTGLPVLILAGSGHVEQGWGIEHRLRTLNPDARCLRIMPARTADDLRPDADTPGTAIFFACAARHKSRLGMNIIYEEGRVRVESVEPDSVAAQAGLTAGDIIRQADGKTLKEASDLHFAAVSAARKKKPLILIVQRGKQRVEIALPLTR